MSAANERVLVTGATGFTGGHLARHLLASGKHVRVLARDAARAEGLHRLGAEVVVGDLERPELLANVLPGALDGVTCVYHIAALFRQENVAPETMWAVNAEATRHLLDASIAAGVDRFVHCSTVGVHGDVGAAPASEDAPFAPGDLYQETKLAGEQIARDYMAAERLPITIFRPAGIYGPGDRRFLKLFRGLKKGHFVMFGSGEVLYQLVYIDDLIDGIVRCGTEARAVGQTYILTGREPITLNALVGAIAKVVDASPPRLRLPVAPLYAAGYACELLCKPLGVEPPLYRRRVDFFRKNRAFSIDKARAEIDFAPRVALSEGLRKTAAWYESEGLL